MSSSCVVWHYLHFYGFLEELVRCIAVLGFVLSQFQNLFLLCHTWLLVLLHISLNRFDLTRTIRFQVTIQYSRCYQCAHSPCILSFTNISQLAFVLSGCRNSKGSIQRGRYLKLGLHNVSCYCLGDVTWPIRLKGSGSKGLKTEIIFRCLQWQVWQMEKFKCWMRRKD